MIGVGGRAPAPEAGLGQDGGRLRAQALLLPEAREALGGGGARRLGGVLLLLRALDVADGLERFQACIKTADGLSEWTQQTTNKWG